MCGSVHLRHSLCVQTGLCSVFQALLSPKMADLRALLIWKREIRLSLASASWTHATLSRVQMSMKKWVMKMAVRPQKAEQLIPQLQWCRGLISTSLNSGGLIQYYLSFFRLSTPWLFFFLLCTNKLIRNKFILGKKKKVTSKRKKEGKQQGIDMRISSNLERAGLKNYAEYIKEYFSPRSCTLQRFTVNQRNKIKVYFT